MEVEAKETSFDMDRQYQPFKNINSTQDKPAQIQRLKLELEKLNGISSKLRDFTLLFLTSSISKIEWTKIEVHQGDGVEFLIKIKDNNYILEIDEDLEAAIYKKGVLTSEFSYHYDLSISSNLNKCIEVFLT